MEPVAQIIIGGIGISVSLGLLMLTGFSAKKLCAEGAALTMVLIYAVGIVGSVTVAGATIAGIFAK